ncbi:MAG: polysaccharide pyruvyl transferase family protein [Arenicellales bacterium]
MIDSSYFRPLFPDAEGIIGYVPMHGNVGDSLIEFATLSLLREWKIPFEIIDAKNLSSSEPLPKEIKHLYISGGGNMGSLYPICQGLRKQAVSLGLPVTVLPQSFTNVEENIAAYDTLWVREKESLALCPSAKLAPDLALSAKLEPRLDDIKYSCGLFLRQDTEALFSEHPLNLGDPANLAPNLAHYLSLVAAYEEIITDRLHFAIAGVLMQRKVTLLPNSYFKNFSMWDTWLSDLNCLWADHPDQALSDQNKLYIIANVPQKTQKPPPKTSSLEIICYPPFRLNDDIYIFADISLKNETKAAWFRLNHQYRTYINELADPFLLPFILVAMKESIPIIIHDNQVSNGLLRNLQQFQRIWAMWSDEFSEINILIHGTPTSKKTTPLKNKHVITSFSGGVDSSFTLFNHTKSEHNQYKHDLSHALLVHGFDISLNDQASFNTVQKQCERTAKDVGIELISMATNLRDFDIDWQLGHVCTIAACMHLLSNGIKTGLVPSTLNYGVLYPWGSTALTDPMHSSDQLRIETDGADYTRIDKVRLLKTWQRGIENIRFCWIAKPADHNCGRCPKCTMTAIFLMITQASRKSIETFPNEKELNERLDKFSFSRLDRSDLRHDKAALIETKNKPDWLVKFLKKLETEDQS